MRRTLYLYQQALSMYTRFSDTQITHKTIQHSNKRPQVKDYGESMFVKNICSCLNWVTAVSIFRDEEVPSQFKQLVAVEMKVFY